MAIAPVPTNHMNPTISFSLGSAPASLTHSLVNRMLSILAVEWCSGAQTSDMLRQKFCLALNVLNLFCRVLFIFFMCSGDLSTWSWPRAPLPEFPWLNAIEVFGCQTAPWKSPNEAFPWRCLFLCKRFNNERKNNLKKTWLWALHSFQFKNLNPRVSNPIPGDIPRENSNLNDNAMVLFTRARHGSRISRH